MFLRATKRFKDGKEHLYWSMVENVRVGRRVFQRQALYLGELNDSQREEWQRAVEALDEDGKARQLKLFPEDRAPATDDGQVVRIRMDALTVRNTRNWGEAWLGLELWDRLGLDGFWASRLGPSRKGTDWLAIMKAIVLYRFTDPGSELQMHTNWLANTAVEELIGPGALTGRSTLYNCLDRVIWSSEEWKKPRGERKGSFKDELFYFLRDRWAGLFGSTCTEGKDADGKVTRIPGDTFVLTRSAARSLKETSMRVKRIRRAMHCPGTRARPHAPPDHRQVPHGEDGRCRHADDRRADHHPAALR